MEIFLEKIFSANFIIFLIVVGLYALIFWCYDNFKSLFQIIFGTLNPYFLPNENKSFVEKFGKWAGRCKLKCLKSKKYFAIFNFTLTSNLI
jgi:hypothetical protein